jgi:hypothetical protein
MSTRRATVVIRRPDGSREILPPPVPAAPSSKLSRQTPAGTTLRLVSR